VSQCWRAKAGKSDPIACGPRCLSLSTLHKHHHLPPSSSSVLSLIAVSEYHLLSLYLSLPPSFLALTHSLPHFLHWLYLPRRNRPPLPLYIATNSSASLLRSPPRPGSSSPRLITTQASLTATHPTRGQPTLPLCRLQHTTHTHQT
jgi:hypothetical protein